MDYKIRIMIISNALMTLESRVSLCWKNASYPRLQKYII